MRASAADAAFANAVTAHATLQEDLGGGGHPGVYVVPVALAIAEQRRCSGLQLLTALVVGYEAADRISRAAPAAMQAMGFRLVPTVGVFGAAAAAGTLLKLQPERMSAAFDLAANMAGGLYQAFWDGTMEGYFHAGFSARSGLVAANIADSGAMTSHQTLEGAHGFFRTFGQGAGNPEALTAPVTEDLAILQTRSKPFPACALNQDTMLMIRALRPKQLEFEDIVRLVLTRPVSGMNSLDAPGLVGEPPYTNMLQAQMSAKFTAIATLLARAVESVGYFRDSFADATVEALARKTELVTHSEERILLEVHMRDGRLIKLDTANAPVLQWESNVAERFLRFAAPVLKTAAASICSVVEELEAVPDVETLMSLTRLHGASDV